MKVFISADIEGVSGVVHGEHTARDGKEHDYARVLLSEEVNACISGVLAAGAKEVVVNDAHGTMRNIYHERLHPKAELILGSPKKLAMMEGIDETFDAAFFLGYHTKMGSNGILNHTFHGGVVRAVVVNGVEVGEFGLNALVAGAKEVPVVFTSGCDLLIEEAKALIPSIHPALVKRTINRTVAQNLHPVKARERIEQVAQEALQQGSNISPFTMQGPFTFELKFLTTGLADAAEIMPSVERKDSLTVSFQTEDVVVGYQLIRSLIMMASTALT